MVGKIIGGVFLGALAATVLYEVVRRENPDFIEKVKSWLEPKEDFLEPEEVPGE